MTIFVILACLLITLIVNHAVRLLLTRQPWIVRGTIAGAVASGAVLGALWMAGRLFGHLQVAWTSPAAWSAVVLPPVVGSLLLQKFFR